MAARFSRHHFKECKGALSRPGRCAFIFSTILRLLRTFSILRPNYTSETPFARRQGTREEDTGTVVLLSVAGPNGPLSDCPLTRGDHLWVLREKAFKPNPDTDQPILGSIDMDKIPNE
jgi:hypothetical protein